MKRLIVNADDFGFSANRNRGIVESVERGIVTSVSILVNFPEADAAIRYAKGRDLGVAVHINLSEGRALAGRSSLTDESCRFPGKSAARERLAAGGVDPADVEREVAAQIDRVLSAGVRVTHLDGHQHVHVFPPAPEAVARAAGRFGIGWIRCPVDDDTSLAALASERRAELETYARRGAAAREVFAKAGLRFTDHFRGAALARHVSLEATQRLLRGLPDGVTEYMVHPGYADAGDEFSGPARELEVRILSDPSIQALLSETGVELTHFGKL